MIYMIIKFDLYIVNYINKTMNHSIFSELPNNIIQRIIKEGYAKGIAEYWSREIPEKHKESITKIMINIRANKKYMCPSEITSKRINIHNGRRTLLKHIGRDKKPLRVFWHTPIDSIHP